jgi:hypothetical protein
MEPVKRYGNAHKIGIPRGEKKDVLLNHDENEQLNVFRYRTE